MYAKEVTARFAYDLVLPVIAAVNPASIVFIRTRTMSRERATCLTFSLTSCKQVASGLSGYFPQSLFQTPTIVDLGRIRRQPAPALHLMLKAARL